LAENIPELVRKFPFTMYFIGTKHAFKLNSIAKIKDSKAFFLIINELSLIRDPIVSHIGKVTVVKHFLHF